MPKDHFGEPVAAGYDESEADMFEPSVVEPAVEFLADLAGGGAALELGIGTGRLAIWDYVESDRCRRATLLAHFGDSGGGSRAGDCCDVCRSAVRAERAA